MKKINLLVCTLLLTLTIFGCKQNADEMSKYSKAPNVTLPPSKGEDILAGKSFNEPVRPYTRWEFNDDGTFTEYDTDDDRIKAVYRYTYDAERKLLSYVLHPESYEEGYNLGKILSKRSSCVEYFISEGYFSNEQDAIKFFEEEASFCGFENVDDYLKSWAYSEILFGYYTYSSRHCYLVEQESEILKTSKYLPEVSFKELFDKYEIPININPRTLISYITVDKIYGFNFKNNMAVSFSYPYTYDISTKVLKYEKDDEIIEVDLKDLYINYDF
ncbi:MAG: hypothetical protein MJ174_08160 [Treponema sp.]|nr:hypothetical protein [Treponema sp.]